MPENNFTGTQNKLVVNKQAISDFLAEEDISLDVISRNLNNTEVSKLTLLFASNTIQKKNIKEYILDDIDESFSDEMSL
jgi:hypothetical protein